MDCCWQCSLPARIAWTIFSHVSPNSSCAVLWLRVAPLRRHSESRSSIALFVLRLRLDYEVRALPAIHLGDLGMRAGLGDVGKAGEIDRFCSVIHVGLKDEVVPIWPRRPVFHVALVVVPSAPRQGSCGGSTRATPAT